MKRKTITVVYGNRNILHPDLISDFFSREAMLLSTMVTRWIRVLSFESIALVVLNFESVVSLRVLNLESTESLKDKSSEEIFLCCSDAVSIPAASRSSLAAAASRDEGLSSEDRETWAHPRKKSRGCTLPRSGIRDDISRCFFTLNILCNTIII